MDWKKLGKALLFPHIALMILLIPVATVLLVFSMVMVGTETVIAYISYVLAAYTLTIWCFRIPRIICFVKTFKEDNKYVNRLVSDAHLRVSLSLYGSLLWNIAYAAFQLWLGYVHSTFWFYSLGGYYLFLAVMRFFLLRHTRTYKPGEKMVYELKKYRNCGWIMLAMNLALSLIVFFMIYWNRTFHHHEITTIAMAAYTFTALTVAIVNIVKYRKYNSPVFSAAKAISLAAACVSMLTLESTMLTTFGAETTPEFRRLMLALTGAAVAGFIIVMSIYMIRQSTHKLKVYQQGENNGRP